MDRTIFAALVALSLMGRIAVAAEFRARLAEATLKDDERTYSRVGVQTDWRPIQSVGNRRYRVDGHTVTEITDVGTSKQRRVSVPEDYKLGWLGDSEGIAFLVADRNVEKLDVDDPKADRNFHRLDLASMTWLDPFKLPKLSIDRARKNVVNFGDTEKQRHILETELLVTPKGIVMLCEETMVDARGRGMFGRKYEPVGYHVSCYEPKNAEAKWDRAIKYSKRAHQSVGLRLWSYEDSIQRLNYVSEPFDDNSILVCTGDHDAIACLKAKDGKVRWRLPAIWEYERGFIGPSVFEHYIERFGLDYMDVQAAKMPTVRPDAEIDQKQLRQQIRSTVQARRKLNEAHKAFYARYQGRITAGPIVVPDSEGRVYVASVRSLKPEPGCATQPEHAFIYQIAIDGDSPEVVALTRLPRAVIGRPFQSVPGGLVMSCDRDCLVRLRTRKYVEDMLLQIKWYREYLASRPDVWLVAEPLPKIAGFSKAKLFRPGRAYIREKGDAVYNLQVNVVDLRTGLDRDLTLSVPFEGSFPTEGTSSYNLGRPSERLSTSQPHAVWIERLQVEGDQLTVVVGDDSDLTAVSFDLLTILADERTAEDE